MTAAVILKSRHSDPEHVAGPVPTGTVTHNAQHLSPLRRELTTDFQGRQALVFEF